MNSTSLLSDLGLDNLSDESKVIVAEQMTEAIIKRIVAELISELNAESLQEFEDLSEGATPEEMEQFFRSQVHDYDERVERIIAEFKEEVKGRVNDSVTE